MTLPQESDPAHCGPAFTRDSSDIGLILLAAGRALWLI